MTSIRGARRGGVCVCVCVCGGRSWGGARLLAHHEVELARADAAGPVAQLPVARDGPEVGAGHVQLGLERLPRRRFRAMAEIHAILPLCYLRR